MTPFNILERFLPVAASAHAADIDRVLVGVHEHMAIQALAWGAFFIYVLIRFRGGARQHTNGGQLKPLVPVLAIAAVIVGDAVLLATTALPAWHARSVLPVNAPLEICVTAEQFAWNIQYPGPDGRFGAARPELISAANPIGVDRTDPNGRDDIAVVNLLTLPLGRPVIVHLTSRDVIHSFTLNEMRIRQDAVPGITVDTWFTPVETGRWDIACSQLCGLGHFRMRGEYTVLQQESWNQWQTDELRLLNR
jgi:cytochrome c oxidase subunit II